MSDFSMFALFTAGLACLAPLASAYTQPTGDAPVGNPITEPGLNSVVPAGQAFVVTWNPTTDGTVDLVLLKGPSTNVIPQYAIATSIPNSGTYLWQVSSDLAPTTDAEGYGIELIDTATGQYQYSTQFGISNPSYQAPSSSSSSASASLAGYGSSTSAVSPSGTAVSVGPMGTGAASTGWYPASNSSIVQPTIPMSMPTSLATYATSAPASSAAATTAATSATASAPAKNAAGHVGTSIVGLIIAAGIAVFAL